MQGEHREQISRGRPPRAADRRPAGACPSASVGGWDPIRTVALAEVPSGVPTRAGVRSAERRGPTPGSRRSLASRPQAKPASGRPLLCTFRTYETVLQQNDSRPDDVSWVSV